MFNNPKSPFTPELVEELKRVLDQVLDRFERECDQALDRALDQLPAERKRNLDKLVLNRARSDPVVEAWCKTAKRELGQAFGVLHPEYAVLSLVYVTNVGRSSDQQALAGAKVRSGGKKGHKKAHGSAQEKLERWRRYQDRIDALRSEFPSYSHNKLCEIAARELDVPVRTLRLRTK